jgi:hypothetical protein
MAALNSIDSSEAKDVIDACLQAYQYCARTIPYLARKGGQWADAERLTLLQDCADVSLLLANFLMRDSRFHAGIAALAQEVASACAESLEGLEHEDNQIRAVYAACLRLCQVTSGEEQPVAYTARDETISESFPGSDPPPTPTQI